MSETRDSFEDLNLPVFWLSGYLGGAVSGTIPRLPCGNGKV